MSAEIALDPTESVNGFLNVPLARSRRFPSWSNHAMFHRFPPLRLNTLATVHLPFAALAGLCVSASPRYADSLSMFSPRSGLPPLKRDRVDSGMPVTRLTSARFIPQTRSAARKVAVTLAMREAYREYSDCARWSAC